jgi:hypothetical protein
VPEVGDIVLDWDTHPLPGNPGPVLLVFTAEASSTGADRLELLASMHATRSALAGKPERIHRRESSVCHDSNTMTGNAFPTSQAIGRMCTAGSR